MPWAQLALNGLALLVYPGLLAGLALGTFAEVAATWALVPERGGFVPAARSLLSRAMPAGGVRGFPALSVMAAVLALLATIQVAAPFNPVPPADRNLLTAGFALAGAAWLTWSWGWDRGELDPRLMVAAQCAWLVALLVPAVVPQNLHPQALGNSMLSIQVPLKVACALLYLMCLPALLHLIPEGAPQGVPGAAGRRPQGFEGSGFSLLRLLLWLPYCGLFVTLFFPPAQEPVSLLSLLTFLALVAGTAAISVAIAVNLIYRGAGFTRRFYLNAVLPFAWITVGLGMLLAAIGAR